MGGGGGGEEEKKLDPYVSRTAVVISRRELQFKCKEMLNRPVIEPTTKGTVVCDSNCFDGQMVRRLPRERKIRPSSPAFPGRVIPVTSKCYSSDYIAYQAPGVIGSVLGLVGRASVYLG